MGILEIEHIMANDNGFAMGSRLQNIVPAMRNQAAAHIDDVAHAIDLAQFTNGIQNHDICVLRTVFLLLRTRTHRKARPLAEMNDFLRAQKFSWRNNEFSFGMLFPHRRKRL